MATTSSSANATVQTMSSWVATTLIFLSDYLARSHSGEAGAGETLNLTQVMALLQRLSEQELEQLYNGTGTSSRQELFQYISNSTMRVKHYEEDFMKYSEFRLGKILQLYISPILILVGTLGNLFSFIILRRKPMLKVSSYMYLAFLSIVDTLVLYIGLLRIWINTLTAYDYQHMNNVVCKFTVVFGYMASDLSVWLIIAVTVERYIVVCFPFKASSMCNVSRAKKVIACLFFLMLALNFHFFFTAEIVTVADDMTCRSVPAYAYLVEEVWPWVDALVYSFLPFVIIMILNALIIREVAGASSNRIYLSGSDHDNTASFTGQVTATGQARQRRQQTNEGSRLTALLLTVSFTFVALTLPNNIALIVTRYWNAEYPKKDRIPTDEDMHRMAKFTLACNITELLMYTNHSINFFLYCATGNKFRQQIFDLLRCLRRPRQHHNGPMAYSHSMRRTSQTVTACETSELMQIKRPNDRKNSLISSESGDGMDKSDYSGIVLNEKGGNALNGCGPSITRADNGNDGIDSDYGDNTCHCNGKLLNDHSHGRQGRDPAKKAMIDTQLQGRRSLRKRFELTSSSSPHDKKVGFVDANGHADNNGALPKRVHSGRKKNKNPFASKRGSFGSDNDLSSRDNEYILLQPTIRWCDSVTQS